MKIKALIIADRKPEWWIKNILDNNPDIEIIITLWDLEQFDIMYLMEVNNIPKIWVYWNHCDWMYMDFLWIKNMHLKTFDFKWIKFWWFEWSIKYKESSYAKMYNQEDATELLKNFEKVDVLITHNPPFWIHDDSDSSHIGFHALVDYIENNSPKYLLHWHTYPNVEVTDIWNTRVIYTSWYKILDLEFK